MELFFCFSFSVLISALALLVAFSIAPGYVCKSHNCNKSVVFTFCNEKKIKWIFSSFSILSSVAMGSVFCKKTQHVESALLLLCFALLIIAAWFDIKLMLIPNFVPVSIIVLKLLYLIYGLTAKESPLSLLINGFLAVAIVAVVFFISIKFTNGRIGGGDIKLVCALAFLLGLDKILKVMLFGFLAALISFVFFASFKKKKATDYISLGPFILLGYVLFFIIQ